MKAIINSFGLDKSKLVGVMASQQILDVETDFGSCCVLTLIVIFFPFGV